MSEENDKKDQKDDKDKKDDKPRFTAEQVAAINKLRDDALENERKALAAEWQRKLDEQKAEFERKIAEAVSQKKDDKKDEKKDDKQDQKQPDPEVAQLKASFEELRSMFTTVKTEKEQLQRQVEQEKTERNRSRKKDLFLQALPKAKVDFYDPLEAYELAEREGLEYDPAKDAVVVKGQAGAPKLNENGEPMNVIDFVKDFATRKNYLVKAPASEGGTGSGEQRRHERKDDDKIDYDKLSNEDFEKLRQGVLSKPR